MKILNTYSYSDFEPPHWVLYSDSVYSYLETLWRAGSTHFTIRLIDQGELQKTPIGEP